MVESLERVVLIFNPEKNKESENESCCKER